MNKSHLYGNLGPSNPIDPSATRDEESSMNGNSAPFSTLMQKDPSTQMKSPLISPIDLAHSGIKSLNQFPNPQTLLAQMQIMQDAMMNMHGNFSHPNLKISTSQKYLLKSKLVSANESLRAAQVRMGLPIGQDKEEDASKAMLGTKESDGMKTSGPVAQFLNYIGDGMHQLESAKTELASLKTKGQSLSTADFLFIQLKLSKAQQELEFTSVLLSKVVDGFKSIMNVQL